MATHDSAGEPRTRLEYLRGQLRAECISYGELHELQSLAEHIEPGDVELLEAAGVPEFPDDNDGAVHVFLVRVHDCSTDEAFKVMRERLNHDEDYGFAYTVEWDEVDE